MERRFIMATSSFDHRYTVTKKDADRLGDILSNRKKAKFVEVKSHKEVKGKTIAKFFGIEK